MIFKVRPITADEATYLYPQSHLLDMLTSHIGTLKGHFREDDELDIVWENCLLTEMPHDFINALYHLMSYLSSKDKLLYDIDTLTEYCFSNPITILNGTEFGLRIDSDDYCFFIRLNPYANAYNFICFCYLTTSLEAHIYRASRGIRFLDSSQKELFRIPDGESIILTSPSGDESEFVCRYTDDAHFEMDDKLYNVGNFDKIIKSDGYTYRPTLFVKISTPSKTIDC